MEILRFAQNDIDKGIHKVLPLTTCCQLVQVVWSPDSVCDVGTRHVVSAGGFVGAGFRLSRSMTLVAKIAVPLPSKCPISWENPPSPFPGNSAVRRQDPPNPCHLRLFSLKLDLPAVSIPVPPITVSWCTIVLCNGGICSRWLLSLLDLPFLFYYVASILRSMPVISWFVQQFMHDGIVKMVLLAEIH
jgi:hypothetical protein